MACGVSAALSRFNIHPASLENERMDTVTNPKVDAFISRADKWQEEFKKL